MSQSQRGPSMTLDVQDAYARWAHSYDSTPNPLLALEERSLADTMRMAVNKEVVELGCGTGRWLKKLETLMPQSLIGVDFSEPMLLEARRKCLPSTQLIQSHCLETNLADHSKDCILASFVISYLSNVERFAEETARILRSGGTLIVSDMHPAARSYGWRRTFKSGEDRFEIETFAYSLQSLVHVMNSKGLALKHLSEASFGEEEAVIFLQAGKLEEFHRINSLPVIYWAIFSTVGN